MYSYVVSWYRLREDTPLGRYPFWQSELLTNGISLDAVAKAGLESRVKHPVNIQAFVDLNPQLNAAIREIVAGKKRRIYRCLFLNLATFKETKVGIQVLARAEAHVEMGRMASMKAEQFKKTTKEVESFQKVWSGVAAAQDQLLEKMKAVTTKFHGEGELSQWIENVQEPVGHCAYKPMQITLESSVCLLHQLL